MNLLKNKNDHINEINEVLDLKENFSENFIEHTSNAIMSQDSTTISVSDNFEVIRSRLVNCPLVLLRLFGFYHQKSDNLLIKGYRFVIISTLWVNSFRYLLSFHEANEKSYLSEEFLVKTSLLLSFTIASINSTLIYINQEFNNREKSFLDELNFLFQYVDSLDTSLKKLALQIKVQYLIGIIIALLQPVTMFLVLFFPDIFLSSAERELIKIHLVPFHKQIWPHNSYWYKFIICTIQSISYIHGNLAFTYFLSYCKIIRFLFKNFNQKLEKYVLSEEINISESKFEKFRMLHLKLVSAVNKMDICYNKLTGFSILGLIVAIIISVYLLQKEKIEKTDFKISLFVGILITITFTFYLLYSVADINTKVSF
jgi:energy-converting hydrogenase Eha subunit A